MSDASSTPPQEFDENPEWTAADFARARRGAPWLWNDAAKACIREAIAELEPIRDDPSDHVERALLKMHEALNELNQPQ